jgi:hypothetical protein
MILICVDSNGTELHWVNLQKPSAIKGSQIYIPISNKFDRKALAAIGALCGSLHRDILLANVTTTADDFEYLKGKDPLQKLAWRQYLRLRGAQLCFPGSQSRIEFTREGWRHMTRRSRSRLVQLQSFQLLGAIGGIIEECTEAGLTIVRRRGEKTEFAVARSAVSFPFRQTAVISLVFRRRPSIDGTMSYSFYTIYEPRRRRTIVGNKSR